MSQAMRAALLVLLLITNVNAVPQPTTGMMLLPGWPNGNESFSNYATIGANVLFCTRVLAPFSGTFTKMAAYSPLGVTGSIVSSIGIYPDTDGGTLLGGISKTWTSSSATVISGTGLSITLVMGATYRLCTCASTASTVRYTTPPLDSATLSLTAGLTNGLIANSSGTGASSCTTGALPATTGALTGNSAIGGTPLVYLE